MGRIGSAAVALLATLLVASGCTQEPPERGAIAPVADREDTPVEPSLRLPDRPSSSGCAPAGGRPPTSSTGPHASSRGCGCRSSRAR